MGSAFGTCDVFSSIDDVFAQEPFLVKDINLRAHSSEPWELANVNDTLFFVAEDATS